MANENNKIKLLFVAHFCMQKIHTYVKFAYKTVRLHDCFVGFYRAKKYIKNFYKFYLKSDVFLFLPY